MVCFINTYTEIVADGWLAALDRHASKPQVGVAAAMGSFESLSSSMALVQAAMRRHALMLLVHDPGLATYYSFVASGLSVRTGSWKRTAYERARQFLYLAYRCFSKNTAAALGFPSFPNPHVRTNGFMMSRERFLETHERAFQTKWDAYAFESGPNGLTAQLRRKNLETIVVDRHGRGYGVEDWCRSGTFRMGDQENLLLTDNQTRGFAGLSPGHRATFVRMTWGDYLQSSPADFPEFGCRFTRDSSVIADSESVAASSDQWFPPVRQSA